MAEKLKDFTESSGTVRLGTAKQCTWLSGETLALYIHFESNTDLITYLKGKRELVPFILTNDNYKWFVFYTIQIVYKELDKMQRFYYTDICL